MSEPLSALSKVFLDSAKRLLQASSSTIFLCAGLLLAPATATADPERLSVFAALKSVEGRIVSPQMAQQIDALAHSVGFGGSTETVKDFALHPTLTYDANMNGGNPPSPLVVGGLTFYGDPDEYAQAGILVGLSATQSARFFVSHGRFIDISTRAGISFNPTHDLQVVDSDVSLCSVNHLRDWWYLDLCADQTRSIKDLQTNAQSTQSVALSRYVETNSGDYAQIGLTATRLNTGSFAQDRLQFSLERLTGDRTFSSIEVSLGQPVTGQLAQRYAMSAQQSLNVANRPVQLAASVQRREGGLVLGEDRDDTQISLSLSTPIWQGVTASLGYSANDSSIDHFDSSTPTFGLVFQSAF